MQDNLKTKRLLETIIMIVLTMLIIFAFGTNLLFYKNSAAPEFLGKYYIYINDKENMNNIPKNTAVICQKVTTASIEVNNVILAIINPENDKAILRVVDMDEDTYVLKSDFADQSLEEPVEDTLTINKENAMALCRWTSRGFGRYVAFSTSNAGIVTMIVLPCTVIVLLLASCILEKDNKSPNRALPDGEETEKERKIREKKEKAEAKRQALIDKNNERNEAQKKKADVLNIDDISDFELEYEENQKLEDTDTLIVDLPKSETKKEIIKTVNDDEYPAVQKKVEEKIAAAERRSIIKAESKNAEKAAVEKSVEKPAEKTKQKEDAAEKTEEIKVTVNNTEVASERKTRIIKSGNVVEKKPEINHDISEKPAPKKPIKKENTATSGKPKPKTAPAKRPVSGNKYSASSKYAANAAKRNAAARASIDELFKAIDSEKSNKNQ